MAGSCCSQIRSQSPAERRRLRGCSGGRENVRRRRARRQRAAHHEHRPRRASRRDLAEIVRGHHDLDAGLRRHQHDLLDAAVAAGSRLAVGSSSSRISGSRASARASASRCCSPPDSRRAGRCARSAEPDPLQQPATRARALAARRAGLRQRIGDVGGGAFGAASPDAETRWRGAPAGSRSGRPR